MSITTKTLWESCVLDERPGAYFGLDTADPLVDDSGNANALTAVNSPANNATLLSFGETGGAAGARDFNGSTQAYTAADSATLDVADSFTLVAVIQPDVVTGNMTFLSKGTNAYQLRRTTTSIELLQEGVGTHVTSTGVTLAAGSVYLVIVAKDGANSTKIWINGVDRTGSVTSRTFADTATSLHIGRKSDSTEFWDGKLDEIAIYPYAFTADMATTLWLAMSAGTFGKRVLNSNSRPAFKVEIAFPSNPRDTYPRWYDVTDYVVAAKGNRGRNFALDRVQTGSWQIRMFNRSRQFDPSYASSPYSPNIILTKKLRVRTQATSTAQTRYRLLGLIDGWKLNYDNAGKNPTVDVQVSGMFKALSLDKYDGVSPQPEELSGSRLTTVLNVAGVRTSIGTGKSRVVGTDLDQAVKLEHSQSVTETEGGILFEACDGTITFQDRHYRILNEAAVRFTFGDGTGATIPINGIDPMLDEDRLFTAAIITPPSGIEQSSEDTTASNRHFRRTKELSTLHAVDGDAAGMAQMYANKYSTTRTRIPTVAPMPNGEGAPAAAWESVLSLEISNRIATSVKPMGDTTSVVREHFIEGIAETWSPREATVSFSVSPAELDSEYWVIGTGKVGDTSGPDNMIIGW